MHFKDSRPAFLVRLLSFQDKNVINNRISKKMEIIIKNGAILQKNEKNGLKNPISKM